MPARAAETKSRRSEKLCRLAMALFVLLTTAARTRVIAADLVTVDNLLASVPRGVSSHELQLGQLLLLLSLDIAGEVLDAGLRRGPLLLSGDHRSLLLLFPFILLGEWKRGMLAFRH